MSQFCETSTTTRMESSELDHGKCVMKSMEIENHGKVKLVMVEKFMRAMRILYMSTNIT